MSRWIENGNPRTVVSHDIKDATTILLASVGIMRAVLAGLLPGGRRFWNVSMRPLPWQPPSFPLRSEVDAWRSIADCRRLSSGQALESAVSSVAWILAGDTAIDPVHCEAAACAATAGSGGQRTLLQKCMDYASVHSDDPGLLAEVGVALATTDTWEYACRQHGGSISLQSVLFVLCREHRDRLFRLVLRVVPTEEFSHRTDAVKGAADSYLRSGRPQLAGGTLAAELLRSWDPALALHTGMLMTQRLMNRPAVHLFSILKRISSTIHDRFALSVLHTHACVMSVSWDDLDEAVQSLDLELDTVLNKEPQYAQFFNVWQVSLPRVC